ncbi:hypothetical protein [Xanthobacter pseudotagetidis]|uniref:hypothetical protein n=1 Tax=Xanthobacter pseudotagetidis TaxID=3119911 RepID=UPI00372C10FF
MLDAARTLAGALFAIGVMALLPAGVAARMGTGQAPAFLATSVFCIFIAGALRFSTQGVAIRLRHAQGLGGLVALWIVLPLAATPAIAISSGLPPLAAWLEATSALTATGVTALKHGPVSLYVWLGLLQWAGGFLTIVSALAILAPAGLGGLPDRTVRGGGAVDAADLRLIASETLPLYAGGTLAVILLMLMDGEGLYVAFTLGTAIASAGAHLPPEAQLALELDPEVKWMLLPFLLWSATSVRWHRALVTRRVNAAPDQPESLVILAYWAVLGVVFGAVLFRAAGADTLEAVRDGLFSAASLISTSGIGAREGTFESLPFALVIAVALLGGGAFSVAGGLKMLRLRAMLLRTRGDLMRLVYPNLVQPASLGEGGMGSAMRGVWVGAAAFFMLFAAVLIAVSPGLPSFEAAFTAAAALVSNTGPVYDAAGKGWPAIASLPTGSVLAAGFAMIAGRLEIIGLAVVVHLLFWRT